MKRFFLLAVVLLLIAAPAQAAGLKKGFGLCRDRPSLTRLLTAAAKNDAAVFAKLMSGPCIASRGGEKVKIASRGGNLAHISVVGKRGSWWTVGEALR